MRWPQDSCYSEPNGTHTDLNMLKLPHTNKHTLVNIFSQVKQKNPTTKWGFLTLPNVPARPLSNRLQCHPALILFFFFFLPLHSCVHNFWPFYTDHLFKERHGGVPRETARQVVAGWFLRNMANTHTHTHSGGQFAR